MNRVRELRIARGLTQLGLARAAGVSLRTIVYVENDNKCQAPTKRAILEALGKTYQDKDEVFPK